MKEIRSLDIIAPTHSKRHIVGRGKVTKIVDASYSPEPFCNVTVYKVYLGDDGEILYNAAYFPQIIIDRREETDES